VLLIVDDIQAGCGRCGGFFSFEEAGLEPDIVTLSKSLSGFGLPLAVTLLKRDLDIWKPGEHNGTFRGNNHAFVTAARTLEMFWADDAFALDVRAKATILGARLQRIEHTYGGAFVERGRGMLRALACRNPTDAAAISRAAFQRGLVIETCGPRDEVVKLLFPLVIEPTELVRGLDLLEEAVASVAARRT
jgi:diaminobutyrate-2-oxoglutarate transaminase